MTSVRTRAEYVMPGRAAPPKLAGVIEEPAAMTGPPAPVRLAVALVGAEALGLILAAAVLVDKIVTGHPHSVAGAWLLVAIVLLGAAVLGLCGRGLLRLRPAARTPVVVLQMLALVVGYSLAFQAGRVGYGGPVLIAAVAVLYLLFTPPAREALDRDITA
jgi:hypothetical protein